MICWVTVHSVMRYSPDYTCALSRYGVKGPVYMKNREGQVVAAGQDSSCEWQSGHVRRYSDHITTTSGCGTSTFRLFDHITVSQNRFIILGLDNILILLSVDFKWKHIVTKFSCLKFTVCVSHQNTLCVLHRPRAWLCLCTLQTKQGPTL